MNKPYAHVRRRGGCRSGFEHDVKLHLENLGLQVWHESTFLPYKNDQGHDGTYLPDFTLYRKDGELVFLEAKGWMKQAAADKMTCVRRSFRPRLDIRIIWQVKSGTVGSHGISPAEWSEWREYPYTFKTIPDEWAAEMMTRDEYRQSGLPVPPREIPYVWDNLPYMKKSAK